MKILILSLILSINIFSQSNLLLLMDNSIIPLDSTPNAPTSIVAIGGNLSATITWTEAGSPDSIVIFGGTSTNPTTAVDTIAGGVGTFTWNTMTEEAFYYVRVKSKKGTSLWSNYSAEDTATVDSTLLLNETFATNVVYNYLGVDATAAYQSGSQDMIIICNSTGDGIYGFTRYMTGQTVGFKYRVKFRAKSSNATYTMFASGFGAYTTIKNPSLSTTYQEYEATIPIDGDTFVFYVNGAAIGADLVIDNITIARAP